LFWGVAAGSFSVLGFRHGDDFTDEAVDNLVDLMEYSEGVDVVREVTGSGS
jgi:hypothetical protein